MTTNGDLLNLAETLDAMDEGEIIHAADLSITRTGDDSYHVIPSVDGRAYLSMAEVIDYVGMMS